MLKSKLGSPMMCRVALVAILVILCLGTDDVKADTCESNLDCCRYVPGSEQFLQCCSEGCCPDCDQVTYVPAMKSYAMKRGCESAYKCCVFKFLSPEWDACCLKHGCCPLCHSVSEGCCYSGTMHQFGTVVEILKDANVNLVCGATLSPSPPYLKASVVPVSIPSVYEVSEKCEEVKWLHCVEESGVIHLNGSEWFSNPCLYCHCYEGRTTCNPVKPKCPPPPHPECIPAVSYYRNYGRCCNEWNCSKLESMCMDAYGNMHAVGEQWSGRDNPCLINICKAPGMVLSAIRDCPPPPRYPPPGCYMDKLPGECCAQPICPECTGENGKNYSAGDTWQDSKDPCYLYECHEGGAVTRVRKQCPYLARPQEYNCVMIYQDCCPSWVCGGCRDQYEQLHVLNSTWADRDDPCTTYRCTEHGTRLGPRVECYPLGPAPQPYCQRVKADCCYVWNCVGNQTHCTDDWGGEREVGEEWYDPATECVKYRCTEELSVTKSIRDCPHPGRRPSSSCVMAVESCCPVWKCPCVDATGTERAVGDVWRHPTNECLRLECTSDGVHEVPVSCPSLPPKPDPRCVPRLESCCPAWSCPQTCPDPFSFQRVCVQYFDQCYSDSNCRQGESCCLVAGCGRECMVSKPGECPVMVYVRAPQCTPEQLVDACQTDQQCPGTKKCCYHLCSKQCVAPLL